MCSSYNPRLETFNSSLFRNQMAERSSASFSHLSIYSRSARWRHRIAVVRRESTSGAAASLPVAVAREKRIVCVRAVFEKKKVFPCIFPCFHFRRNYFQFCFPTKNKDYYSWGLFFELFSLFGSRWFVLLIQFTSSVIRKFNLIVYIKEYQLSEKFKRLISAVSDLFLAIDVTFQEICLLFSYEVRIYIYIVIN